IIFQDLLILGSEVSESYDAAPGHIRAYHVKTGEMEWIFHTIPQPGEPGYETWPKDAWRYTGGANNWGGMSLDESRGMVYAPLGSPTYDFYGANRKGKNLYGNCLVALNAATGELIWHFQTIHHDLWDYDLPAPPTLVQVKREGKTIDAVSLTSKVGFLYVFNRETGEPLFPIEERPVPPSRIPEEEAWPTQPFPLKPEPYVRQAMDVEDLTDVSEEARAAVLQRFEELYTKGFFTPPDSQTTLLIPGTRGGSEWGGTAFDPESGVLFLNVNESPELMNLQREQDEQKGKKLSLYDRGKKYYLNYCAICHGSERQGVLPHFPSLVKVKDRLDEQHIISLLERGKGRMPAFSHLSDSRKSALAAFLLEQQDKEFTPNLQTQTSERGGSYRNLTAYSYFRDPEGYPAIKPPWGTLNAIDLNTGEYIWRIPLGNFSEKQVLEGPETGTENWGGPIATAGGLVFIAATQDRMFRAFDSKTGELKWETELPGGGYATPSTYLYKGRQYVILSVSGTEQMPGGAVYAFALGSRD
ncbi:MAG: c-type cytochrome, partial [Bacteroidota bacterium]